MEKTKLEIQMQFNAELTLLLKKYPGINALLFIGHDQSEFVTGGKIGHDQDVCEVVIHVLLKHPEVRRIVEATMASVIFLDQLYKEQS